MQKINFMWAVTRELERFIMSLSEMKMFQIYVAVPAETFIIEN